MKYETILLELNIKLDKRIYSYNLYQYNFSDFLNHFFIGYLDSDKEILQREEEHNKKNGKKNLLPGLIQTLATLQENIFQTIHYDLIKSTKNFDTIHIQFQFNFYEKNYSLENFIDFLFDKSIGDNMFMAEQMLSFSKKPTMNEEDKLKAHQQMKMYEHLGQALKQSKTTVKTFLLNPSLTQKKQLTLNM